MLFFCIRADSCIRRFLNSWLIWLLLLFPYQTLFDRYVVALIPILGLYVLLNVREFSFIFRRKFICALIMSLLLLSLEPYLLYSKAYQIGYQRKILYMSLPQLLRHKYEMKDVDKYVDLDGDFKK